jgi:hypothetical protein
MKTILQADFKLRELISKSGKTTTSGTSTYLINYERALQIQRTVNSLFLAFFNAWVKTDTIAKKFLTELNGFDFLLDRLFAKADDSVESPVNLEMKETKKDEKPIDFTMDDLFGEQVADAFTSEEDDTAYLFELAMKKVSLHQKEAS